MTSGSQQNTVIIPQNIDLRSLGNTYFNPTSTYVDQSTQQFDNNEQLTSQHLVEQEQHRTQQHEQEDELVNTTLLDELLINEVKIYRCLWDTSYRSYKELPKKNEA